MRSTLAEEQLVAIAWAYPMECTVDLAPFPTPTREFDLHQLIAP